jgi:hypothetical protein
VENRPGDAGELVGDFRKLLFIGSPTGGAISGDHNPYFASKQNDDAIEPFAFGCPGLAVKAGIRRTAF